MPTSREDNGGCAMLVRADNVEVYYRRDLVGLVSGKYHVVLQVGCREHLQPGRITVTQFRELARRSEGEPVAYGKVGERTLWRLAGRWYSDNEDLSAANVGALLGDRQNGAGVV